jgi:plastocyanin
VKKSLGLLLAALAIVAMAAFAGCGDDDDDGGDAAAPTATETQTTPKDGGGKATTLKIAADPGGALKFDKTSLTAPAGEVTIDMDNPSSVPHSVSIENGVDKEGTGGTAGVGKGEVSTVTADLKPGKYTFYCPVPGHEAAGMKGTLTVK